MRLPYGDRWTTKLQRGLGEGYHVIVEGLNGRTTVIDDAFGNPLFCGDGGEGMNGRRYLTPCLHSHKPVDLVVLSLGCNDLKARNNLQPCDIAAAVRILVMDIQRSAAGVGDMAPAVLVLSHPELRDMPGSPFGCSAKRSAEAIQACREKCAEMQVPFVDVSEVASVGSDGVHFDVAGHAKIGERMVREVKALFEP